MNIADSVSHLRIELEHQAHPSGAQDFRAFAESLPHLVWITHGDGKVDHCNKKWFEYTGRDWPEDWASNETVHPDDRPNDRDRWLRSLATGEPYEAEHRLRCADGEYRWHLTRAIAVSDKLGKIQRWIGTCTDIEDRKRQEEQNQLLSDASRLLGTSLDEALSLAMLARISVPRFSDWCSIYVLERETTIRRVVTAHSDPGKEALAQKHPTEFKMRAQPRPGIERVIATGYPEIEPVIAPGALEPISCGPEHLSDLVSLGIVSYLIVPIRAGSRTLGAISFIAAESSRHFGAKDLETAEELGRRAGFAVANARLFRVAQETIRAREDFLSIASHELKTPLTSLALQLELIERGLDPTGPWLPVDRIKFLAKSAGEQVRRLGALTGRLLDVSRIRAGRLVLEQSRFCWVQALREILDRLESQISASGCQVTLRTPPSLVGFWDRVRIEQVMVNLLVNALKYGRGHPVEIALSQHEDRARFEVKDQGIGIAPEDQSRIFERFERSDSARQISESAGLGLGLYIVRQIVLAHGGSIRVQSQPDAGSTFTVELPI